MFWKWYTWSFHSSASLYVAIGSRDGNFDAGYDDVHVRECWQETDTGESLLKQIVLTQHESRGGYFCLADDWVDVFTVRKPRLGGTKTILTDQKKSSKSKRNWHLYRVTIELLELAKRHENFYCLSVSYSCVWRICHGKRERERETVWHNVSWMTAWRSQRSKEQPNCIFLTALSFTFIFVSSLLCLTVSNKKKIWNIKGLKGQWTTNGQT